MKPKFRLEDIEIVQNEPGMIIGRAYLEKRQVIDNDKTFYRAKYACNCDPEDSDCGCDSHCGCNPECNCDEFCMCEYLCNTHGTNCF